MNLESYINIDPPELVDYDASTEGVGVVLERNEFELWIRQLTSRIDTPADGAAEAKEQEQEQVQVQS